MARDLATGASGPPIPAIFTAGEFGDVGADLWKCFEATRTPAKP